MDIKQYISSGIIETYVMGLCTSAEEKELELLRSRYPELNKAIIACEEEMEQNMLRQTTLPPTTTDERILTTLAAMKKPAALKQLSSTKRNWLTTIAVAASLLLILSAGLNYYQYRQIKEAGTPVSETSLPLSDYKVLLDPAITPIAMYGVGTHAICRCTMFWDKKTGKMYIMIHHLPKSSSAKDYQLWAMVNGEYINTGIVNDEIRGKFIEMNNVPPGATAFTVTLEKAGGNSVPTIEETYLKGVI
jgi:Anti-sigma-K factor rskA